MCCHVLVCFTIIAPLPPKNTTTVVDDQTGDSGMGTGSGSAEYVLNEWRQAMTHPPPGIIGASRGLPTHYRAH